MNELITTLYIGNAIIATAAYTPQCWTLWHMLKTDKVNQSVSLLTWVMWSWACTITAIYAVVVHPDDLAFLLISVINAILCIVTVILTALVHHRSRQKMRYQIHEK